MALSRLESASGKVASTVQSTGRPACLQESGVLSTTSAAPLIAALIYMLVTITEGAVRYATVTIGMPWVIYLRDVMVICVAAWALLPLSNRKPIPISYWIVFSLFVAHCLVGFFRLGIGQTIFGAKILSPLFLGLAMALNPRLLETRWYRNSMLAIVFVGIVGVYIDYFIDFPWLGMMYSVGDVEVEGARQWWSGGVDRLAGFGRQSADTAIYISYACLAVLPTLRSSLMRLLVIALSVAAAWLTTTKAVTITLIAITPLLYLFAINKARLVERVILLTAYLVATVPPALCWIGLGLIAGGRRGVPSFLASFVDRWISTWPGAMKLLSDHGDWMLGRGVGGIGIAQRFEAALYNPADNITVYAWLTFGVAGFVYLYWLAARTPVGGIGRRYTPSAVALLSMLFFFTAGATTNLMGNPVAVLWLGFTIGVILNEKEVQS